MNARNASESARGDVWNAGVFQVLIENVLKKNIFKNFGENIFNISVKTGVSARATRKSRSCSPCLTGEESGPTSVDRSECVRSLIMFGQAWVPGETAKIISVYLYQSW